MAVATDHISDDVAKIMLGALEDPAPPHRPLMAELIVQTGIAVAVDPAVQKPGLAALASDDVPRTTIEEVLSRLASGQYNAGPQMIKVSGVFFGCHLLYPGWWTRGATVTTEQQQQPAFWDDARGGKVVTNIRHWLNTGFEQWGPSWDLRAQGTSHLYVYGQIGHGDESNSLPIIVAPSLAMRLRIAMGGKLAIGVVAKGMLLRAGDERTGLSAGMRAALGRMIEAGGGDLPYYLVVDEEAAEGGHGGSIEPSADAPAIYSAYMWQCLIRQRDEASGRAGRLPIDKTVFLWEHTNLLDPDSIRFNFDALQSKKRYLENTLGEKLLLLQHSYAVDEVVGGSPAQLLIDASQLSRMLVKSREALKKQMGQDHAGPQP